MQQETPCHKIIIPDKKLSGIHMFAASIVSFSNIIILCLIFAFSAKSTMDVVMNRNIDGMVYSVQVLSVIYGMAYAFSAVSLAVLLTRRFNYRRANGPLYAMAATLLAACVALGLQRYIAAGIAVACHGMAGVYAYFLLRSVKSNVYRQLHNLRRVLMVGAILAVSVILSPAYILSSIVLNIVLYFIFAEASRDNAEFYLLLD